MLTKVRSLRNFAALRQIGEVLRGQEISRDKFVLMCLISHETSSLIITRATVVERFK